jgi:adenosylcobinamide-phosphate synthase
LNIYFIVDFTAAYFLDLLLGDPEWLYHPVRAIGAFIQGLERLLRLFADRFVRKGFQPKVEKFLGIILALATICGTFGAVWLILELARRVCPIVFHLVNCYILYTALATRCLVDEALKVQKLLKNGDLPRARQRVGMLVGRETDRLSNHEIIRAVVETTAENTVDGVISPMIYAAVGSLLGIAAPLAYAFKAVSTLDSMVGYKNERYLNFGWASAKLDDAANFLPARLSGLLIPVAAWVSGKNFLRSFKVMLRDRRNHASPNCAYPEAAVAGALGIQLGGSNVYFGQLVYKPTIGDALHPMEIVNITETVKLMLVTSLLTMAICIAGLLGILK